MLDDDRRPAFEDWLECRLDGLAPGIRADAEAWLRTLRNGGPRSRPRSDSAAWSYMFYLRPLLLAWSAQYGHLREVTRGDVLAAIGEMHGHRRHNVLIALRSLFASCKKRKSIFRSPVQGVRVGEYPQGVIQPLSQDEVDQAAEAAATPGARLGLVLAAMHAARVKAIREVRLDDVNLGNRRITIGGRTRPLDELTREVLIEWLAYRAARWPSTANPYLLVNHRSANGTGPVSTGYFAASALRGTAVTLERLRVNRQMQEALAVGPDPLHLASEQDPGAGTSTSGGRALGGEARMSAPGGDTLAGVAETLAGLSAAAAPTPWTTRPRSPRCPPSARSRLSSSAASWPLSRLPGKAARHGPASQPRRVPATGRPPRSGTRTLPAATRVHQRWTRQRRRSRMPGTITTSRRRKRW